MTEKTIEERLTILETFIATQQAIKDLDAQPIREKIAKLEKVAAQLSALRSETAPS